MYGGFYCANKGQTCCALNADIERFEAYLAEHLAAQQNQIIAHQKQQQQLHQKQQQQNAQNGMNNGQNNPQQQPVFNKPTIKPTMKPQPEVSIQRPHGQASSQAPVIADQQVNVIPAQGEFHFRSFSLTAYSLSF